MRKLLFLLILIILFFPMNLVYSSIFDNLDVVEIGPIAFSQEICSYNFTGTFCPNLRVSTPAPTSFEGCSHYICNVTVEESGIKTSGTLRIYFSKGCSFPSNYQLSGYTGGIMILKYDNNAYSGFFSGAYNSEDLKGCSSGGTGGLELMNITTVGHVILKSAENNTLEGNYFIHRDMHGTEIQSEIWMDLFREFSKTSNNLEPRVSALESWKATIDSWKDGIDSIITTIQNKLTNHETRISDLEQSTTTILITTTTASTTTTVPSNIEERLSIIEKMICQIRYIDGFCPPRCPRPYSCSNTCVDDTTKPTCYDRTAHPEYYCSSSRVCCESQRKPCPT